MAPGSAIHVEEKLYEDLCFCDGEDCSGGWDGGREGWVFVGWRDDCNDSADVVMAQGSLGRKVRH